MKKVLILVNHDVVIYNFRKELVEELIKNNYKVYISSPYGQKIDYLIDMGCEYIDTSIERHGTNIIKDFQLILKYRKIIKNINPDIVLSYTIKPNIYGGMACRLTKTPYIGTVTGLGGALEKEGLMQKLLIQLYKFAFKDVNTLFLQNESNMDFFVKHNIAINKHKLIPGSGVNLEEFSLAEYPKENDELNLLFIGRIMKDKGIEELIEAAQVLKEQNVKVNFDAIGFYEGEYAKRVKELEQSKLITFHGSTNDVKDFIKNSHAVILPSHHEGMANVLLEAAAMGRPILASSIPGCQETFDEGVTGYGFEPKDVESLVQAIYKFLELSQEERNNMGKLGRKKVELEFDRKEIVATYISKIEIIIQ